MVGRTNAVSGCKVICLGNGRTFDVSDIAGYENLTEDNFIVEATCLNCSGNCEITQTGYEWGAGSPSATSSSSLVKSYNPDTGILSCSLSSDASGTNSDGEGDKAVLNVHSDVSSFRVHLVTGQILAV
ncbi:MAG: hypothetical protein E7290_01995 [Lachnospiraceae bacterium]|nr:hypothetical protein [Lachnospiraceae bacterium]